MRKDIIRLFIQKLKPAAAAAIVCLSASMLLGCGIGSDTADMYKNTFLTSNHKTAEKENFPENAQDQMPQSELTQETSYNAYVYNGNNAALNTVIEAGTFGFQMSRSNNNADRRLAEGEFAPAEIALSEEAYGGYIKWLNAQTVTYVYSDLYGIDDALAEAEKFRNAIELQPLQHTDLLTDIGEIPTAQMMKDIILENNEQFLMEHPEYSRLDNSWIEMISEILVSAIEKCHSALNVEDLTKIYCMLKDITAVEIDSSDFTVNELQTIYNARVTEDGVILLDTEEIANLRDAQSKEKTISHEIIHLFQRMCPDHQLDGCTQLGNSLYFDSFEDDELPNSLHFQWLYEAAAEQISMELSNAKTPLVYKNMVGYLNTLDLITLIRPENAEHSIAMSQMSCDHEKIYEVFGAETPEEKRELIEMLYSICYIQNEREDFELAYEKEYGSIDEKQTTIKREMKQSAAKTMTKYFCKNLAERITHSDVDLQDAFYLMNVFESALNGHLIYDDEERYDLNQEAIEYYIQAQDELFRIVGEANGFTYEEITGLYAEYALVIKTGSEYQRNASLSWMTEAERNRIGDILTTNIGSVSIHIRDLEFAGQN